MALSPYASSDEHCQSDSEHPEHLYALGKFVRVDPSKGAIPTESPKALPLRRATHCIGPNLERLNRSPQPESSDAEERDEGTRGRKAEKHKAVKPMRSHTFAATSGTKIPNVEDVS